MHASDPFIQGWLKCHWAIKPETNHSKVDYQIIVAIPSSTFCRGDSLSIMVKDKDGKQR